MIYALNIGKAAKQSQLGLKSILLLRKNSASQTQHLVRMDIEIITSLIWRYFTLLDAHVQVAPSQANAGSYSSCGEISLEITCMSKR